MYLAATFIGGYVGTTVAYLLAQLLLAGLLIRQVARTVGSSALRRPLLLPAFAGGMAALPAYLGRGGPPLLVVSVALLVYGVSLFIAGSLEPVRLVAARTGRRGSDRVSRGSA
jgi:hypothetical protein